MEKCRIVLYSMKKCRIVQNNIEKCEKCKGSSKIITYWQLLLKICCIDRVFCILLGFAYFDLNISTYLWRYLLVLIVAPPFSCLQIIASKLD